MSRSALDELIARVNARGKSGESPRKIAQSALLTMTPRERQALRSQMGIRAAEREDPARALARLLAAKRKKR